MILGILVITPLAPLAVNLLITLLILASNPTFTDPATGEMLSDAAPFNAKFNTSFKGSHIISGDNYLCEKN